MKLNNIITIALIAGCVGLTSCGAKYDAKSITKELCDCKNGAEGMAEKAECLKVATAAYTEAISNLEADELTAFKDGYKAGKEACD